MSNYTLMLLKIVYKKFNVHTSKDFELYKFTQHMQNMYQKRNINLTVDKRQ